MPLRRAACLLFLALLASDLGCAGTGSSVPPEPPAAARENGGMFLRTGAFKLGPDVGEDLLRPQGDGDWGAWSLTAGAPMSSSFVGDFSR